MLLRARLVVPVVRPPIEDGVISITGDRIDWVGRHGEVPPGSGSQVVDLGDCALLPGLINAHCHLDYTGMAGQLEPPKRFTDWLKAMVALKGAWTIEEFAASWRRGAEMLVRTGTTTVADIEALPELLPALWQTTPLRVISFRELITVKSRWQLPELVERAVNDCLGLAGGEGRVGLSPHAPYTTSAQLLELAARAAHRRRWRLVTHVAESEEEFEMFVYRQGAMHDWLKSQRDMTDCGLGTPVEHLERCGYLDDNVLAVHANYLGRHDATALGHSGASVVHCPRSHDYFRHLKFPRAELESAGVNLCLGTDSLASVRKDGTRALELSMFSEMKVLAATAPDLAPEKVLSMATVNPARALGRSGDMGELTAGALADVIAVPFAGPIRDVYAGVTHHEGPVSAALIGGHWAVEPQQR